MTQYSGQGRERLVSAAAATSDANGAITFRVGPCPLGFVWQGSVTVTNAPSGALFNSSVASTPWGQHAGPTNFGPVQLWGNETLVVTGVGLQKNTQYSMLFFGVAMPEELAEPVPPVAPLSTVVVETTTLLVSNQLMTAGNGGTQITVRPPTLTRRMTLIIDATNLTSTTAEIDVVGTTTNVVYAAAVLHPGQFQTQPIFMAIEPAIDAEYTILGSAAPGGTYRLWVVASTVNSLVDNLPTRPLAVTGTASPGGGPPINVSGSPVGPFDAFATVLVAAATTNTVLVAAPGAGQSIYLQQVTVDAGGVAYNLVGFHASGGGAIFARMADTSVTGPSKQYTFPGGLELPSNASLQVDNAGGNNVTAFCSYTTGPTV